MSNRCGHDGAEEEGQYGRGIKGQDTDLNKKIRQKEEEMLTFLVFD